VNYWKENRAVFKYFLIISISTTKYINNAFNYSVCELVRSGEKMMKKLSISMFILLAIYLAVPFVNAAVPLVNYNAISDTITDSDNTAVYRISLSNVGKEDDKFQFYTISAFWDIDPSIVSVPAGSTTVFDMNVVLNDRHLVGPQLVPVTVKSLNSEDIVVPQLYVYIKPSNVTSLSYTPNVVASVNMPDQIDPRNPLSVEIKMQNRNPLDMKDLRIVIESKVFSKEVQTTLGPLEGKTNQILVDLNELQEPGIYDVNVRLVINNKTITQVQKEVKVLGYSQVSVEQTTIKNMFSYTSHVRLHNDGNYEAVKQVKIQKNFIEKIFTTSSVKYSNLREDGVTYITWNVPLQPQESYDITITTNYTSLVIIILIIIAVIIMYYIFRSPVLLYKRAKIVASTDDGITEIRVKLHLKNRSGREIRSVKVIDRYPKIVSLVEDIGVGSMKPTKLLSADKAHSLLMWNIEALEPYEERLLSYTIKSSLHIVGNMHLHSAKAKFLSRTGERVTSSNDVMLLHRSVNSIKYENSTQ